MIGKTLGGRYEIIEEIGKGGMAVVYKAKCRLLNRIVAVKVLRTDLGENKEFLRRFNTEAQAAASLSNQNIVSIYDVGEENGIHYIVMEYIEGVTLKDYIEKMGKLSWNESVKIAIEICKGLASAHEKNIVHRDIKPQNIIVTNTGAIKVADFGIARAATTSTMTADNDVLGSVYYFSPEQARGGFVDVKSDIYSLGVVMYEMLTGKVPYEGDSAVAIAMKHIENTPDSIVENDSLITKSVEDIVFKAMEKDTSKRYQTVIELENDLNSVIVNPSFVIGNTKMVDDDINKTRVMQPIKTTEPKKDESKKDENKKSKGNKKAIILAIITSLIFVSILSAAAISFLNLGGAGSEKILVPSVMDMSIGEAEKIAKENDFIIEIEDYKESEKEEDTVISQSPRESQVVTKKGTVIKVILSKKINETIELENYENKKADDAKEELEKLGLKVVLETAEDTDVKEGYVVKQDPKDGKKVSKGDTIKLYVSGSESEKQVAVPNLVNKTTQEAQKMLESVELELGEVSYAESDVEKDTIISQGLTGFVNEGTKINVVISKGEKEEVPDNNDVSVTPVKKTKTLSVDLSGFDSTVKIDIVSNGKTVHSTNHNAAQSPMFSATLTGNGTISFDIYVDGQKVGTRAINFDN